MKMKRIATILFITVTAVIFSINANTNQWYPQDDRSISLFLSIEESDLHIYSDKQWDNIGIQIIDPNGRIIYVDVITIPAEEKLTIPLSDIPQGNYQVILTKDNQPVIWYLSK